MPKYWGELEFKPLNWTAQSSTSALNSQQRKFNQLMHTYSENRSKMWGWHQHLLRKEGELDVDQLCAEMRESAGRCYMDQGKRIALAKLAAHGYVVFPWADRDIESVLDCSCAVKLVRVLPCLRGILKFLSCCHKVTGIC
jgi:hypothetical protein